MDLNSSNLRVTARLRSNRKISEAMQSMTRNAVTENRQKRVFGTNRCTNIPSKINPTNASTSTLSSKLHNTNNKLQKSNPKVASSPSTTSKLHDDPILPTSEAEKKLVLLEKTKARAGGGKKKRTAIKIIPKEGKPENKASNNPEQNQMDGLLLDPLSAKTPDLQHSSPAAAAATKMTRLRGDQISVTPYLSAQNCSKCRFDKLETSSYWLGQIRLAENVGKHFVSASFFNLASECKAEPVRNLRIELKKYMKRHEYLKSQAEWKGISLIYGLLMEEPKEEHAVIAGGLNN